MAARTARRTFERGTPKSRREKSKHKEPKPSWESYIRSGGKEYRYHATYKTKREAKETALKGKGISRDTAGHIGGYRIRQMKDNSGRTWHRLYTRTRI